MKKSLMFIILSSAIIAAACSSGPKKDSPSALDALWVTQDKSFSAKSFTQVRAWAPGQYTVTGNIVNGRKDSITRSLIVRKESGGWVFESTSTDRRGKVTGMQMLITGYEKAARTGNTDDIRIVWIKILNDDGTVQQLEQSQIMLYNMTLQSTWDRLITVNLNFENGGPVTVPAGRFAGTSKADTSVKILFKTIKSTSWMHPDVPVNGVVKTSSDDGKSVSELIDFGFNGTPLIK